MNINIEFLLYYWPLYLIGIVVIEILFHVHRKYGAKIEFFLGIVICFLAILAVAIPYYIVAPHYFKPISLLVAFISFITPIVIFLVSVEFLSLMKNGLFPHILMFIIVVVTMSFFPLFAFYVSCFLNFECL